MSDELRSLVQLALGAAAVGVLSLAALALVAARRAFRAFRDDVAEWLSQLGADTKAPPSVRRTPTSRREAKRRARTAAEGVPLRATWMGSTTTAPPAVPEHIKRGEE